MITFINNSNEEPYKLFYKHYNEAFSLNQNNIEAASISTFNPKFNEVSSRLVNIKYIDNNKLTFFTNYNSRKGIDIISHDQISMIFFWNKINTQIRIKAKIRKTSESESDEYFSNRNESKNILAVISKQTSPLLSYQHLINKYNKYRQKLDYKCERPEYWGGYDCMPYYFEFWHGHENRLNKRQAFKLENSKWVSNFLYP